ncbi:hypothetical protein C8T65DRAFT_700294 [Cerioporus squamosus]|nr:hypothetical protein C8T65DRAFT_700294 [Cerioporus squamosus]
MQHHSTNGSISLIGWQGQHSQSDSDEDEQPKADPSRYRDALPDENGEQAAEDEDDEEAHPDAEQEAQKAADPDEDEGPMASDETREEIFEFPSQAVRLRTLRGVPGKIGLSQTLLKSSRSCSTSSWMAGALICRTMSRWTLTRYMYHEYDVADASRNAGGFDANTLVSASSKGFEYTAGTTAAAAPEGPADDAAVTRWHSLGRKDKAFASSTPWASSQTSKPVWFQFAFEYDLDYWGCLTAITRVGSW